MTDKITVPRETWDAMREALEKHAVAPMDWACAECRPNSDIIKAGFQCSYHDALTAANAVSEPQGDVFGYVSEHNCEGPFKWQFHKDPKEIYYDNCKSVTAVCAHPQATEPQAQGVSNPLGWYCVSRDGLATQCADQRDAEMTAKSANRDWPNSAPYRAVQLCEFEANPQATEPAEKEDPLQGAVDWLLQADGEFFAVATVQRTLRIGYNRAKRLADMARERAAGPEAKQ